MQKDPEQSYDHTEPEKYSRLTSNTPTESIPVRFSDVQARMLNVWCLTNGQILCRYHLINFLFFF